MRAAGREHAAANEFSQKPLSFSMLLGQSAHLRQQLRCLIRNDHFLITFAFFLYGIIPRSC
jgi:hypothetical protein